MIASSCATFVEAVCASSAGQVARKSYEAATDRRCTAHNSQHTTPISRFICARY